MAEKVIRTYSIKDLEKLSGIKAHTIRIWEKRYKLITPARTPTNIRYYSGEDLRKILNVSTLLSNGGKISKISLMSPQEITRSLEALDEQLVWNKKTEKHINELISIALEFDQVAFDEFSGELIKKNGLKASFLDVFFPLLSRIGDLWARKQIAVTHEHFLSSNFRKLLFKGVQSQKKRSEQKILLFLPQWEEHELLLLLSYTILSQRQVTPIYLGPKVPLDNLIETIEQTQPTLVLTVLTLDHYEAEMKEYMDAIFNTAGIHKLWMHQTNVEWSYPKKKDRLLNTNVLNDFIQSLNDV